MGKITEQRKTTGSIFVLYSLSDSPGMRWWYKSLMVSLRVECGIYSLRCVPAVQARSVGTTAASEDSITTGSQTGGVETVRCCIAHEYERKDWWRERGKKGGQRQEREESCCRSESEVVAGVTAGMGVQTVAAQKKAASFQQFQTGPGSTPLANPELTSSTGAGVD